jgi:hypothetical protein
MSPQENPLHNISHVSSYISSGRIYFNKDPVVIHGCSWMLAMLDYHVKRCIALLLVLTVMLIVGVTSFD